MRRVKSDRWDNLIERLPDDNGWVRSVDAVKLLRREHRALERWAKDKAKLGFWDAGYQDGYHAAITNLLDWLHARAR